LQPSTQFAKEGDKMQGPVREPGKPR
jgi:hypothetical protein